MRNIIVTVGGGRVHGPVAICVECNLELTWVVRPGGLVEQTCVCCDPVLSRGKLDACKHKKEWQK